jgi:NitT/TauT family transport system ATP-binding protein
VLQVEDLGVDYQSKSGAVKAIERISFRTQPGEFLSIVGPSGCGKSTLLQCLSGLRQPTRGSVLLDGVQVVKPPEGMSVVFQEYGRSLFPWLTVGDNVALPLDRGPLSRRERLIAAGEALERVGLDAVERLHPWQLSGGMQQRVAIARALVSKPALLLMDEPFASVDAQTRIELEDLLLELWQDSAMTVLFVTHDIDEAAYLSDRVLVLSTRPSTVQCEVPVALPRPRDQVQTKSQPEYIRVRTSILERILVKRPSPLQVPT